MKTFMKLGAAVAALTMAGQAMASSSNGFGVGTSAAAGQFLDIYGGVASTVSAYRTAQNSSGTYTNMGDVPAVSFGDCSNVPDCSTSQGGTNGPGFDLTSSLNSANLNWYGGVGSAAAYANLATGKVGVTGSAAYYQNAYSVAQYVDTLNFNVAGAGASTITNIIVEFQLDGTLVTPDAPLGTSSLGGRSAQITNAFRFGSAGGSVLFRQNGANPTYNVLADLVENHTQGGWVSYTWDSITPQLTKFTGVYALSGISQSLSIYNGLNGISGSGGSFNYGNTSSLSFVLPSNVTFTSASGTFLSALTPPPSGTVPEPATWATMLAGFAAMGFAMRRKHATALRVRYA